MLNELTIQEERSFPFVLGQKWAIKEKSVLYFTYEFSQKLDRDALKQTILYLVTHHDLLRLRIYVSDQDITQYITHTAKEALTLRSLADLSYDEQNAYITQEVMKEYEEIICCKGSLIRFIYFENNITYKDMLVILIHHCITDAISNEIIIRDFTEIYHNILQKQKEIYLPPPGTSYQRLGEALRAYTYSNLQRELDYWFLLPWEKVILLPQDADEETRANSVFNLIRCSLSVEETHVFLAKVRTANLQVPDMLLAILGRTLAQLIGEPLVSILFADNGRIIYPMIIKNINLINTVGFITTNRRILLHINQTSPADQVIRDVKEQMSHLPYRGITCDVLESTLDNKDIVTEIRRKIFSRAHVFFNYLGTRSSGDQSARLQDLARLFESTRKDCHAKYLSERFFQEEEQEMPHIVVCDSYFRDKQLWFEWKCAPSHAYKQSTLAAQMHLFMEKLRDVLR